MPLLISVSCPSFIAAVRWIYLHIVLYPYNTWVSILNCTMDIRRKYNCEQGRLEHLKMSPKYFCQQVEILTLNLFAKKRQFYLQSTSQIWGEPSKSSCLITNLHKKSSPSNWAFINCSFLESSKVTAKHTYLKNHLGHKSKPLIWMKLHI